MPDPLPESSAPGSRSPARGSGLQVFCVLLSALCLFIATETANTLLVWVALVPWLQALLLAEGQRLTGALGGLALGGLHQLTTQISTFGPAVVLESPSDCLPSMLLVGGGLGVLGYLTTRPGLPDRRSPGVLPILLVPPFWAVLDALYLRILDAEWHGLWLALPLDGAMVQSLDLIGIPGLSAAIVLVNLGVVAVFNSRSVVGFILSIATILAPLGIVTVLGADGVARIPRTVPLPVGVIKAPAESLAEYREELLSTLDSPEDAGPILAVGRRENTPLVSDPDSGAEPSRWKLVPAPGGQVLPIPGGFIPAPGPLHVGIIRRQLLSIHELHEMATTGPTGIVLALDGSGLLSDADLHLLSLLAIRLRLPFLVIGDLRGEVILVDARGHRRIFLSSGLEGALWLDLPLSLPPTSSP